MGIKSHMLWDGETRRAGFNLTFTAARCELRGNISNHREHHNPKTMHNVWCSTVIFTKRTKMINRKMSSQTFHSLCLVVSRSILFLSKATVDWKLQIIWCFCFSCNSNENVTFLREKWQSLTLILKARILKPSTLCVTGFTSQHQWPVVLFVSEYQTAITQPFLEETKV